MDIDEIRRKNLRALEAVYGGAELARRAGMSPSQFYNLRDGAKDSKTGKRRGMRKETAWKIEDAAGVERGYLDREHTGEIGMGDRYPDSADLGDPNTASSSIEVTRAPLDAESLKEAIVLVKFVIAKYELSPLPTVEARMIATIYQKMVDERIRDARMLVDCARNVA